MPIGPDLDRLPCSPSTLCRSELPICIQAWQGCSRLGSGGGGVPALER